jgi:hypothetical protein
MSDFNSGTIARFAASVTIAAGIATWSAPSDARVFNRASHSAGHRLHFHSFPHSYHQPFAYSYHRRGLFGHRSYFPYGSYCSVFGHYPCVPEFNYPIGQDLQLTIESRAEDDTDKTPAESGDHAAHDLDTIRDVFSALRACWKPPAKDVARPGTQMTVRLSFNRYGGPIAEPRVTYVTPDTPPDVRQVYRDAVADAFKRCTPLQFTDGLGGALAGRPFVIRYVDNRAF